MGGGYLNGPVILTPFCRSSITLLAIAPAKQLIFKHLSGTACTQPGGDNLLWMERTEHM